MERKIKRIEQDIEVLYESVASLQQQLEHIEEVMAKGTYQDKFYFLPRHKNEMLE